MTPTEHKNIINQQTSGCQSGHAMNMCLVEAIVLLKDDLLE